MTSLLKVVGSSLAQTIDWKKKQKKTTSLPKSEWVPFDEKLK